MLLCHCPQQVEQASQHKYGRGCHISKDKHKLISKCKSNESITHLVRDNAINRPCKDCLGLLCPFR